MTRTRRLKNGLPALVGVLALMLARTLASCAGSEQPAAAVLDAGPEPDAGIVVIPPPDSGAPLPCKAGGWCEVSLPAGAVSLNGIWGSGLDDVWLVGSPDLTLHWDGKTLAPSKLQTMQTLFGVWGSSKNDVWTYSSGAALWHSTGYVDGGPDWVAYDAGEAGSAWSGPVHGLWGRGPGDVWTVGPYSLANSLPTVWHCDGWHDGQPRFTGSVTGPIPDQAEAYSFNAIWGNATSEIWIVGMGGKTRLGKEADAGASWVAVNSETVSDLYAVWGSGNGEVWAAGAAGTLRRFTREGANGSYRAFAVDVPTTATLYALTGFGPDDVWAAGSGGTLLHWNGKAWSAVDVPVTDPANTDLYALWGSSAAELWVGGRNTLLYRGAAALPEKAR